jgi:uncharacterized protein (TIGR00269 family)
MSLKCRFCGKQAVERLRQYRLSLCRECYVKFYERQVERTLKKYRVVKPEEKVLACISGGKDSSAMLTVMSKLSRTLNFELEALFIDLNIKNYSEKSFNLVKKLCRNLDVNLNIVKTVDYGVDLNKVQRRKVCSACGTVKRYVMNRFARENGFDCVATGHTSDDIVAFFFKNWLSGNLRWSTKFLPRTDGFDKVVTKIRPLYLLSERENALYCICKGLPFMSENCPHAPERDEWKDIIYEIERKKPGFRRSFVTNLIRYLTLTFEDIQEYKYCKLCGEVTTSDICAFCKLRERKNSLV